MEGWLTSLYGPRQRAHLGMGHENGIFDCPNSLHYGRHVASRPDIYSDCSCSYRATQESQFVFEPLHCERLLFCAGFLAGGLGIRLWRASCVVSWRSPFSIGASYVHGSVQGEIHPQSASLSRRGNRRIRRRDRGIAAVLRGAPGAHGCRVRHCPAPVPGSQQLPAGHPFQRDLHAGAAGQRSDDHRAQPRLPDCPVDGADHGRRLPAGTGARVPRRPPHGHRPVPAIAGRSPWRPLRGHRAVGCGRRWCRGHHAREGTGAS